MKNVTVITMADDERDARPPYVHTVSSGLPDSDDAPTLDAQEERRVGERLREIVEARAEAAVNARDYLIH